MPTALELKAILKGLLKRTTSAGRVERISAHIREIETVQKKRKNVEETRIGAIVSQFLTVNNKELKALQKKTKSSQVVNILEVIEAFLYNRLVTISANNAPTIKLDELGLVYRAGEIKDALAS